MDEEEQVIDPFSSPDEISDVTLIVQDKKIFAHKSILGKKSSLSSIERRIRSVHRQSVTRFRSNVLRQWISRIENERNQSSR